jgi:F-type H+-transporting ATPase subunit c
MIYLNKTTFSFVSKIALILASLYILNSFISILSNFFDLSNVSTFLMFSSDPSHSLIDTEVLARRIGSGLATAGLGGVGTGIGMVFSGLIKGFARNPSLKDDLFSYAIFGFALTEAIGLFALMIAFMLLYA